MMDLRCCCRVCGNKNVTFYYSSRRAGISVNRCLSCDSSYVSDYLTDGELRAIYDHAAAFYDLELHFEYEGHGRRLRELSRLVPTPAGRRLRLLDVGCGTGRFLALAKNTHDWEIYGTEFAERPIQLAKQRHGIEVFAHDLCQDRRDGFYDIITMWGLLEHVRAPKDLIAEVARLLAPGGIVGLLTPVRGIYDQLAYMLYCVSGRRVTNLLDHRNNKAHLSILSKSAVSSLLVQQGLRILVSERVTELGLPAETYLNNIGLENTSLVRGLGAAIRFGQAHSLFFRNNLLAYAQKPATVCP